MITALVVALICALGSLIAGGIAWWLNDRHEQRAADAEWGRVWPARTFRSLALPYKAAGSYRAAPRRTGPLYPVDLPGPETSGTVRAPAAGLLTARTPGEAGAADRAGESPVAVPGWGTGRAATRPGAADSGRLTPRPATKTGPQNAGIGGTRAHPAPDHRRPGWPVNGAPIVPGRVPTQESPARPGTSSLPGTAVSGGRTHTPHPQGERSPAATTYDQLLAMATAVNDAWLDRLFAGAA